MRVRDNITSQAEVAICGGTAGKDGDLVVIWLLILSQWRLPEGFTWVVLVTVVSMLLLEAKT